MSLRIQSHRLNKAFYIDDFLPMFSSVRRTKDGVSFVPYTSGNFNAFVKDSNGLTLEDFIKAARKVDLTAVDPFYKRLSKWELRALSTFMVMELSLEGSPQQVLAESLRKNASYYVTGKFQPEQTRGKVKVRRISGNPAVTKVTLGKSVIAHRLAMTGVSESWEEFSMRKFINSADFTGWSWDATLATSLGIVTGYLVAANQIRTCIKRRNKTAINVIGGFRDIFTGRVVDREAWPYKAGHRSPEGLASLELFNGEVLKVPGVEIGVYAHYMTFLLFQIYLGRFNDPISALYCVLRLKGMSSCHGLFRLLHNHSLGFTSGLNTQAWNTAVTHDQFAANFTGTFASSDIAHKSERGVNALLKLVSSWKEVTQVLGRLGTPKAHIDQLEVALRHLLYGETVTALGPMDQSDKSAILV